MENETVTKLSLKPGARLQSAVSDVQIMAIKVPPGEYDLRCGGVPMVGPGGEAPGDAAIDSGDDGETLMGKRYVDEGETVEFLCTKGGAGSLTLDGTPLAVKQAKKLPSSD